MNEENYTSLKLSKLLEDNFCMLSSRVFWGYEVDFNGNFSQPRLFCKDNHYDEEKFTPICEAYDILNDICVKYSKDFFGEGRSKLIIDGDEFSEVNMQNVYDYESSACFSIQILRLLQQGKKQAAENYFFQHCLFNPKNQS